MNLSTKKMAVLFISVCTALGMAVAVNADTENGFSQIEGQSGWYYFEDGEMVTGWKLIDGSWYYFEKGDRLGVPEGKMFQGIGAYDSIKIGNEYYVFDSDGKMVTGLIWNGHLNAYRYADSSGKLISGWKKIDGSWYYFDPGSHYRLKNTFVTDGGNKYYLGSDGKLKTGWFILYGESGDSKWYYADKDGKIKTGWIYDEGYWYYIYEDGTLAIDGVWNNIPTNSGYGQYCFDEVGRLKTSGWIKNVWRGESGVLYTNWYYADASGLLKNGWFKVNGKWYFGTYEGILQAQWNYRDNNWYYFDKSGAMTIDGSTLNGWKQIEKYDQSFWLYYESVGKLAHGWKNIDGKWYFFDRYDGKMMTGVCFFDEDGDGNYNECYWFDTSGALKTGWCRDSIWGIWRYFTANGVASGWKKIDGEWYYFGNKNMHYEGQEGDTYDWVEQYVMYTGWNKIGGKWYYFYNSGVMAHDVTIGGYTLGSTGAMI